MNCGGTNLEARDTEAQSWTLLCVLLLLLLLLRFLLR